MKSSRTLYLKLSPYYRKFTYANVYVCKCICAFPEKKEKMSKVKNTDFPGNKNVINIIGVITLNKNFQYNIAIIYKKKKQEEPNKLNESNKK